MPRGTAIETKEILVIKLTSMGDLMHALPALTDARKVFPDLVVDWVVDESFAEVPSWHPAVRNIYKTAHRRWRKSLFKYVVDGELYRFYRSLNANRYDAVIDAQNNIKSSLISFLRKGPVHGMDSQSVAEKPAHLAYHYKYSIDRSLHAIARQRRLFANALGYDVPGTSPDYGIREDAFVKPVLSLSSPYVFLVHNASWTTKLWPIDFWNKLISYAAAEGFHVVLPGGSREELDRAATIAGKHDNAVALPRLSLSELGGIIKNASGAFCCDTGLAHLTAITGTPAITLYGPTSARLVGTTGKNQQQLIASSPPFSCAPCYKRYCDYNGGREVMSACMNAFSPESAWEQLQLAMSRAGTA